MAGFDLAVEFAYLSRSLIPMLPGFSRESSVEMMCELPDFLAPVLTRISRCGKFINLALRRLLILLAKTSMSMAYQ
jgi:hypothetical protein